ncbi:MAG: hypothetical protein ACJ790_10430, partial [Myxococcaceae bacterium]
LLSGCPGKQEQPQDAGVADSGVQLSAVELCGRLAAARCGLLQSCYAAFLRDTVENCRVAEETRCEDRLTQLKASFDQGLVKVDADALARCEQRMSGQSCPATFPPGYPAAAAPFADCDLDTGLLDGTLTSGQDCRDNVECAPGSRCGKETAVCFGSCATQAAAGEPCGSGCLPGLYCDTKGTDSTVDDRCAAAKAEGDGCVDSSECAQELICVTGTCRARGKPDDSCAFDPLRGSTCGPGLACDVTPFVQGATGTCIKPRGVLGSCQFHWSCAPGLVCAGLDWSEFPGKSPPPGTCVPPQSVNSACTFTPYASYVGDSCGAGSACGTNATCQPLAGRGENCTPTALSCSGVGVFCKPVSGGATGTCSGPASVGERCGVQIDNQHTVLVPCSSGYCDPNSLTCLAGNKAQGAPCTSDGECSSSRCTVLKNGAMQCASPCN